jgi:diguanylate cyclase (GGDEF)-like protein
MRQNHNKQSLIYLLILTPTLTELLVKGRLSFSTRDLLANLFLTAVITAQVILLRREYLRVARLSETDSLTGLFNRRKFLADLSLEVQRARRLGTSVALAYIDVDNFKSINDRYGHCEGDRILRYIGYFIKGSTRRGVDKLFRIGGDEFVVLLPMKNQGDSEGILKRLASLGRENLDFLERIGAGLSVGIVELEDDDTPESFLKQADKVMYLEKERKSQKERPEGVRDESCAGNVGEETVLRIKLPRNRSTIFGT